MAKTVSINNDNIRRYMKALSSLHKSALPNVVRFTLNDIAFDVRNRHIEKSADKLFIRRQKNLFKKLTIIKKATGYLVSNMFSEVGLLKNEFTDSLKRQEIGGVIPNRNVIPSIGVRPGRNIKKKISRPKYVSNLDILSPVDEDKKDLFFKTAFISKKENKPLLYKKRLYKVKSFKRPKAKRIKNKKTKVELIPLYTMDKGKSVTVKKNPFLENAVEKAMQTSTLVFHSNMQKQIEKLLKNKRI